jgi:hypothetical protein
MAQVNTGMPSVLPPEMPETPSPALIECEQRTEIFIVWAWVAMLLMTIIVLTMAWRIYTLRKYIAEMRLKNVAATPYAGEKVHVTAPAAAADVV